jgi:16S rRNA (guanine527-N7)-methyltransferase
MRHIFDSLTLVPILLSTIDTAPRIIDVGSGGGLPGIPLAICLPEARVTLLETTGKKARFLDEAVRELGLENVDVVQERAEIAGHDRDRHREQYDAVIARAVGPLRTLLEITVPFAKSEGIVLAVKGAKAEEEIADAKQALHALHARVVEVVPTPTGRIVVIEKLRKTPRIYPRRAGEPKRAPL